MGSNDADSGEKLVHQVTVSTFWMGKYEVTQAGYQALIGKNPSNWKGSRLPVEQVSWNDAMVFCAKLTAREKAAGRLLAGYEYRLPTEAEWEYAARGGTKSKGFTYSGENDLKSVAWFEDNSGWKTHDVGGRAPNELGLYDMSGNVWEWCLDGYGDYPSRPVTDPKGPATASGRVYRGGCWSHGASRCRVAGRCWGGPDAARRFLGFRVCLASSP